MATNNQNSDPNSQISVEYYVVCVIDLLGQSETLKHWARLPTNKAEEEKFLLAMKRSLGVIAWFKTTFMDFFDAFERTQISPAELAKLSPQQREIFERCRDCSLSITQFSDTFVFHAPLRNQVGDVSSTPIYRMMSAAAMAMITSLAGRTALRGAITIGLGVELDDCGFYGPALAEAHHIESRLAGYPRIIVADRVKQFVMEEQSISRDSETNKIMLQMTKAIRPMLHTDVDGYATVDFLGEFFHSLGWASEEGTRSAVFEANKYVEEELARFQEAGNDKLANRYRQLHTYMRERIHLWQT